jgi:hypothetical protein
MKLLKLFVAACACSPCCVVAETLDTEVAAPAAVAGPARGSSMATVEAHFGAPITRHDAVGQPPITRWDYAGFSVFFEHDRVIHAVTARAFPPPAG